LFVTSIMQGTRREKYLHLITNAFL
jgi:hypothetical protein